MINAVPGVDEARKQRLIKVLDINPEWRMHQVSDGQRRRVQICVGLLRPFKVSLAGALAACGACCWAASSTRLSCGSQPPSTCLAPTCMRCTDRQGCVTTSQS